MKRRYHRVLTIAGSDSGGGAGIQADLKTIAALGCYGLSVITAVTAQNTTGVTAVHAVPGDILAAQLTAVLTDMGADAVKIGMLLSPEAVRIIADGLSHSPLPPIVLDPVMSAQSGGQLLHDDALEVLKTFLLPRVHVLTPNLPEAERLLNRKIRTAGDMPRAARDLAGFGSRNILLKGGHLEADQCVDWLYLVEENRLLEFPGERVQTRNDHGTGCTLSAAVAALLARGESVAAAVAGAKHFLTKALKAGESYRIGRGRGPLHHFHAYW
ncbi:MAG: bifunctional hydroxymethylpyrimidine kinase/phosphomethylpyrimidine kinase [Thermodesulfobacteriota bacterium]